MKDILYLHGYKGDSKSTIGNHIRDISIIPDINYDNLFDAENTINNYITENNIQLLIGNSLGGFFANHFSEKYNIPCILINPCISIPSLDVMDIKKNTEHYTTLSTNDNSIRKIILLGENDDLFDYKITKDFFHNKEIFLTKDTHKFKDLDLITKAINSIYFPNVDLDI